MTRLPSISVVVPTWQRAQWLDRCLAAVVPQSKTPDEIVVVGRADDADARSVVEFRSSTAPSPVRWVEVDRPGHVAPVIRGMKHATGDIVAFLDDDVIPQEGWLSALVQPFDDDSIGCVGGRVVTPGLRGRVYPDAGQIRWYGKHVGNIAMVVAPNPFDVMGVLEGNWAWRRTMLSSLGFDRRLDFDDASMYGLDLTLQARERGFRVVYQSAAVVVNASAPRDPSLDRGDRAARTFSYSRNYTVIACRHLRGIRLPVFLLWWFLVGERGSYGAATALVDFLASRAEPRVVFASFRGKIEGVRVWLAGATSEDRADR